GLREFRVDRLDHGSSPVAWVRFVLHPHHTRLLLPVNRNSQKNLDGWQKRAKIGTGTNKPLLGRRRMGNQHSPKLPKEICVEVQQIPLDMIDPYSVQSRVSMSPDQVAQYVIALTEHKVKFSPIEAFAWLDDAGEKAAGYFTGDGFHRQAAYEKAGKKTIP